MLARGAINHSSKLHSIVAQSTFEAEYMAICKARKEAVWLGYLLEELKVRDPGLIQLKTGNRGLIALASNQDFHRPTKCIDVQFHWIRVDVAIKKIEIRYIPTNLIAADELTKRILTSAFLDFCKMIRMQLAVISYQIFTIFPSGSVGIVW